jgi:hypothetical protein
MARAAFKLITLHIRLSEYPSTRPDCRSPAANEATIDGRAIHNWFRGEAAAATMRKIPSRAFHNWHR